MAARPCSDNELHRCGGVLWNEQQPFGAITVFAASEDIPGVTSSDTTVSDSTYDGSQFKGGGEAMPDVAITDVTIEKSNNGAGILAQGSARGNAKPSNVTITDSATEDILIEPGSTCRPGAPQRRPRPVVRQLGRSANPLPPQAGISVVFSRPRAKRCQTR